MMKRQTKMRMNNKEVKEVLFFNNTSFRIEERRFEGNKVFLKLVEL
jgi:hypothetical protein